MPELAEVEYFRTRWDAGVGQRVGSVALHAGKRLFRGSDPVAMERALRGATLLGSETRGKQMLFRFSKRAWLGVHLGMTGELRAEPPDFEPGKHDHLVLFQKRAALVFSDARMFGRVRFHLGTEAPDWWSSLPPAVTSTEFTAVRLREILERRARLPLKALLLMQEFFPGVGNWMADEILWQARLHPRTAAGDLEPAGQRELWQVCRAVCRTALKTIGVDWGDPPRGWLLHVRWKKSGLCPRDGTPLERATIGGRTTAWCAHCQLPAPQNRPRAGVRNVKVKTKAPAKKRSADLKPGDRVEWDTSQGPTTGRVKRKVTAPMKIKWHKVVASKANPQFLVQSEKSGKAAAHKPGELRKVKK